MTAAVLAYLAAAYTRPWVLTGYALASVITAAGFAYDAVTVPERGTP